VLDTRYKACFFGSTVLECKIVVVNWKDFVFCAVDEEKAGTIGRVKSAVLEEGEPV